MEKQKKFPLGSVIFYGVLLAAVAAFFAVMSGAMHRLEDYLARYQQSHINTQYPIVFQELFGEPDWAALYDMAGLEDTEFENRESYAAYMEEKVGDRELKCFIESNGTKGKKCPVYLGDEEIGVFYMVSTLEENGDSGFSSIEIIDSFANSLKMQSWKLERLELHTPERNHRVTVQTGYGRTVLVNSKPLDEGDVVQTVTTVAEKYLKDGLQGYRTVTYRVEGFLIPPEVSVLDENGGEVPFFYSEELGMYTEAFPEDPQIPEERATFLAEAVRAYCKYMIRAEDHGYAFSRYFDRNSETYRFITSSAVWMQDYKSYSFGEPEFSEYRCYGDSLYTLRLKLTLNVHRHMGTVKEYPIDATFFVELKEDGKWMITNMVNLSVQEQITHVRLDFVAEGELLSSMFVDAKSRQLTAPAVSAPEGKTFAGWFRETVDDQGDKVLSLVFTPDSNTGIIYLPEGTALEPMVLHPRFE